MGYDVAAIRQKLKKQMSGKFTDPDEWRPPKAESTTEALKFRFFILPPIAAGTKLKSGVVPADQGMEHFFIPHANHWINDKPYPCPRVWDGSDCPICQAGFDMLKEEKDEDARKNIIKTWMPNTYYMVNIYFTASKNNPEDLRGKVKFFNAPKTCFDVWTSTLMKDDSGDPEDPEAFGIFFDENAAFQFQLELLKQGRNNNYKTSKFIANGGQPQPMLADPTKLEKLLMMRHNLFDKIEKPDPAKIERLARIMLDGDDSDDDGGFDEDEVSTKSKGKSEAKTDTKSEVKTESKKTESKKTETKKEKPKVDDDDDDVVGDLLVDDDADVSTGDDLADELPLDEAPVTKKAEKVEKVTKAEKKTESKKPEPEADDSDDDSDDGDDEIDALLDQLEDDDD